jgi:hypothetical protein
MAINLGSLVDKISVVGTEKIPCSGSGNPSLTPNLIRTFITPFVTPEQLGAVGDGSTNDQSAIQNAINTGFPVLFGAKNYRVNSTLTLPSSAKLEGCGESTVISTTSNISVITIAGKKCQVSDLTVLGNDTGAAQIGINITGNAGLTLDYTSNVLSNVKFRDLNLAGLYVTNVLGTTGSLHQGAVYAVNCLAESCTNGFYFDNRAEYNSLSNCVAYACATGVRILAGNVGFYGGQIVDGTTGVVFATGSNDGKCVFDGVRINHNAVAVSSGAVTLGSRFIGCQMIANGSVTITAAATHEFIGCQIGNATLTITNSPATKFINCRFQTATTLTITGTAPKFFGCTWDTGIPAGVTNTIEGGVTYVSILTPAQLTVNTDNYAPTGGSSAHTIRIDSSGVIDLTGLSLSQVDGRELNLVNIGANNIVLKNDVTSTAANRFLFGADFTLLPNAMVRLNYDGTSARWRKVS